jgi:hypothetical protein
MRLKVTYNNGKIATNNLIAGGNFLLLVSIQSIPAEMQLVIRSAMMFRTFVVIVIYGTAGGWIFQFFANNNTYQFAKKLVLFYVSQTIITTMKEYDKFITVFHEEWCEIWFQFTFKIAKAKNTTIPPSREMFRNWNLSLKTIEKYTQYPWDYDLLSQNPNLTFDFIMNHPNENWNWMNISKHHAITLKMMLGRPDMPWNWGMVGANPNVTPKHILNNLNFSTTNGLICLPWNWTVIGNQNQNLTMKFILENYDKIGWCDYPQFTSQGFVIINEPATNNTKMHNSTLWNDNISLDFVAEHPEIQWNFSHMAHSDRITMEAIGAYPTIAWDWAILIANKNLTMDFIFANAQKIPYWHYLASNSNLTPNVIKNHPEIDWKHACRVGSNPNFSTKFMLEHPELEMKNANQQIFMEIGVEQPPPIYKWVLTGTSKNETLSMQFVLDNLDLPWCVDGLMENRFLTDMVAYIKQKMTWLFIMTMYEQNNVSDITPFNMILHDEYLVKMIVKY